MNTKRFLPHAECWLFFCVVLCSFPALSFAKGFTQIQRFPGAGYSAYGDFNGDGKIDLVGAFCQPGGCGIHVALGNGDGTFQDAIISNRGAVSQFIAVGDFNGDHNLDLVMFTSVDWGSSANSIEVFLGDGHGQFGAPITMTTEDMDMSSFAVGDFNGDGRLDVLEVPEAGEVWNSFSLFLGNGDGTFKAPISSTAGNNSRCTQVGDFNGDGKLDAVTWGSAPDFGMKIHLANADGTFQAPLNTSLTSGYGCPVVADFNGDGKLDIAGGTNFGDVAVIYGNGDGTFGNVVTYKIPHPVVGAGDISIGDFNGDGKPDLLVNDFIHLIFYVLTNKGAKKFSPPVSYMEPAGGGERVLPIPDVNSDGKWDVILGDGAPVTLIGLSQHDGTLKLPRSYLVGGLAAVDAAATDLNQDHKADLFVMSQTTSKKHPTGLVSLLLGKGAGTFSTAIQFSTKRPEQAVTMAVADLNADGNPDVLVADTFVNDQSFLTVYLGNGTQKLPPPLNLSLGFFNPIGMVVGDFNGDGKPDVALVNGFFLFDSMVILGNGDGTFRFGANLPPGINALATADFNHDGKLDLVVSTADGVGVMLGNGDGTFKALSNVQPGQSAALLVADFNGDGFPDVAGFGSPDPQTGIVSAYLGNGDGTLQPAINSVSNFPYFFARAATADFDGDGNADLAVAGLDGFLILSGKGDGTFNTPVFYEAGANVQTLVAADFNGDGVPDLAILNTGDNSVDIYLNTP
jgi:hypothetical protein